jgi:hypothetical protein
VAISPFSPLSSQETKRGIDSNLILAMNDMETDMDYKNYSRPVMNTTTNLLKDKYKAYERSFNHKRRPTLKPLHEKISDDLTTIQSSNPRGFTINIKDEDNNFLRPPQDISTDA